MRLQQWYLDALSKRGHVMRYRGEIVTGETDLPDDLPLPALPGVRTPRRGRRPLSPDGVTPVSVKLPTPQYQRLRIIAVRMGVTVPELIRRALRREIPPTVQSPQIEI